MISRSAATLAQFAHGGSPPASIARSGHHYHGAFRIALAVVAVLLIAAVVVLVVRDRRPAGTRPGRQQHDRPAARDPAFAGRCPHRQRPGRSTPGTATPHQPARLPPRRLTARNTHRHRHRHRHQPAAATPKTARTLKSAAGAQTADLKRRPEPMSDPAGTIRHRSPPQFCRCDTGSSVGNPAEPREESNPALSAWESVLSRRSRGLTWEACCPPVSVRDPLHRSTHQKKD